MDKCKYYLNIDGFNATFNSDKELTDFVKNNLDIKKDNFKIPDNITMEIGTSKTNTKEYRFFIGSEYLKNKNEVRVTENYEKGEYSIHEGDLSSLSKSDKINLFKAQDSVLPKSAKIVNHGKSSLDGIRHRLNLEKHG